MLLIQSEYNYLLTIPQFAIGMFQTDVFKHSTDFLFFGFCSLCPNLSEVVIESIFAHNCLLLFFFLVFCRRLITPSHIMLLNLSGPQWLLLKQFLQHG